MISSDHVLGFAIGVGACAAGFYFYVKNQDQVNDFLRQQGINIPESTVKDYGEMTIEELILQKEKLEDMIAEKQVQKKGAVEVPAT